ncbi:MAG: CorA family divalent cation transporter, partial [Candidatus Hodarchaeota archaeon]
LTPKGKIVTVNQIESKEFQNIIKILNVKQIKEPIYLFLELIQAISNRLDSMSHQISIKINEIQKQIITSRNIQKVHDPFKINSFMIFFSTAMQGNYNALEAYINKNFKLFENDPELYEKVDDLMIDIEQVYKFSTIYRDQVRNLVDQTNNIINNNLNNVFKVVGSISLLISIPTLIASFYGMNVFLPGGTDPGNLESFYIIMSVSFSISFAIWLIFRKLRWL